MCADLGTRKGASIDEIGPQSEWIRGKEWMSGHEKDFPVKTVADLVMDAASMQEVENESIVVECGSSDGVLGFPSNGFLSESPICNIANALLCREGAENLCTKNAFKPITKIDYEPRYEFAKFVIDPLKYVIDPLKYRFRKVIRVLGLVFLFISKLRKPKTLGKMCNPQTPNPDFLKYRGDRFVLTTGKRAQNSSLKCTCGLVVILSAEMTKLDLSYYFTKATAEIFEFLINWR